MSVNNSSLDLFNQLPLIIRRKFTLIILSTLFLGFLEMLTMSMIIPIITIFIKGNYQGFFSEIMVSLGMGVLLKEHPIIFIAILFFVIFFVKFIYSIWHAFYQSRYIYDIQEYITSQLYKLRGLPSFQKSNDVTPQHLVHKITNETTQLTSHFSVPLSIIFSELATVFALIILMFVINFLMATIFLTISISSSAIFYLYIRKRVKNWGEERIFQEQKRSDFVMRGIHDGVQFTLLGLKKYFLNIFNKYNQNISNLLTLQRSFLLIPRVVVEFFFVVSIFTCIAIYFYLELNLESLFISITLIAFIGMRIMPSLNKVAISFQEFRFAGPLIKSILDELKYDCNNILKFASFRNKGALYISQGFFIYKKRKHALNLSANEGESILITGPSGCGKSTLLKSMLGFDRNFKKVSFRKDTIGITKIAFLGNSSNLFILPLIENVLLGRKIKNHKLQSIINFCMLNELDLLGEGGKKVFGENKFDLSTGEKQRLVLARALVSSPKILVLDESLSALDKKTYLSIEKNLLEVFQGLFIHVSHHFADPKKYKTHINFKF
jgi:ABC-type multidrug transport system fused ATPase/permease subunit